MPLASNIEPLLQREVSRKEFLITLGLGMASIFGFSTIIRLLTGKSPEMHLKSRVSDPGSYGGSDYGG